jgi:SecD/SecF fusion protein
MPRELPDSAAITYEFQKNPRIVFVVDALAAEGLKIKPSQLETLGHNWTVVSGQFSDSMRNNAIMALLLSLIGVLLYIALRFEWKYAVSSVLALVHDVGLTLAVMAIANRYGAPVQLNLETIGAIMTIIGYSLNDTIIVFDRIREDMRLLRKKSFAEIINCALNQTLSRTLMTSGTTLLVLLALDLFAGASIFGFAFVMTVGVFLGTLSSLFIAAPILLWLHDREEASRHLVEVKAY